MAVVLVCGAPASGKSSVTKRIVTAEVVVLNRDTEGGSISDSKRSGIQYVDQEEFFR